MALLVVLVYAPVIRYDLVNFDDDVYITDNPQVLAGLTMRGVGWAFGSFHAGYWIPLTWLSYMADVSLQGGSPGSFHLTNLLLHAAAAALLFLLLGRMMGALGPALLAAALFAVHPVHVESVAWVTERKDVLSGFCFMLTLLAYIRYLRRPDMTRLLAVAALFALALMAKPMVVTLPFLMLILDWWPLGRFKDIPARRLLLEKVPLLLPAATAGFLTIVAHARGGVIAPLRQFPLGERAANLLVSIVRYLRMLIFPSGLAVLYPLPLGGVPGWMTAAALVGLALLSWLVINHRRRLPSVAAGWGWFTVGLVPVSGLFQAGSQALADRFLYLPAIGIYLAAVGVLYQLTQRRAWRCAAFLLLVPLALAARRQVGYWTDSETLFQRAVTVTQENAVAHHNLARSLVDKGRVEEGVGHFHEALRIDPGDPMAHFNLGNALVRLDCLNEAAAEYATTLRLNPAYRKARFGLGLVLARQGDLEGAAAAFRDVVRRDPDFAAGHYQLGLVLAQGGDVAGAAVELSETVRLEPGDALAHHNLGAVLEALGDDEPAAFHFREARRLRPDIERESPPDSPGEAGR